MRRAICLATLTLALAACDENTGWNPNYAVADRPYGTAFDSATPYAHYKVEREKALIGQRDAPKTVPLARPFKAPTAAEIAGPNLWQIIQRDARALTDGSGRTATTTTAGGTVVAAQPLTATSGPYPGSVPVLARYAVEVSHAPGTMVWPRASADPARALRVCRGYATVDAAQIGFLAKGGPQADPMGMDPDGDGYVCGWNPAPWRRGAGL